MSMARICDRCNRRIDDKTEYSRISVTYVNGRPSKDPFENMDFCEECTAKITIYVADPSYGLAAALEEATKMPAVVLDEPDGEQEAPETFEAPTMEVGPLDTIQSKKIRRGRSKKFGGDDV